MKSRKANPFEDDSQVGARGGAHEQRLRHLGDAPDGRAAARDQAIMHRDCGRLVLKSMKPLDEDSPEIEDPIPTPERVL